MEETDMFSWEEVKFNLDLKPTSAPTRKHSRTRGLMQALR
jgi:hypothetical protein